MIIRRLLCLIGFHKWKMTRMDDWGWDRYEITWTCQRDDCEITKRNFGISQQEMLWRRKGRLLMRACDQEYLGLFEDDIEKVFAGTFEYD